MTDQQGSLVELIAEASAAFDEMCQTRNDEGAEKYGPLKFLGANTVEEAMFELADLSNYARYTFIKLWLLNVQIDEKYGDRPIQIGSGAFMGSRPDIMTPADKESQQ